MLMNAALILLFFQGKKLIFIQIAQFIHSTIYGYLGCSIFGGLGHTMRNIHIFRFKGNYAKCL